MNILTVNSVTTSPAAPAAAAEKLAAPQPDVAKSVASASAERPEDSAKVVAQPQIRTANTMRFSLGGDDGEQVIIEIYDAEKGRLIRTIPYEAMEEKTKGMVLSVTV